jgi:hypothetical protein
MTPSPSFPESRSRLGPAVIESFGVCAQIGTSRSIDDDDDDEGEMGSFQTRFYSQSSLLGNKTSPIQFWARKRTEPTIGNPDHEA